MIEDWEGVINLRISSFAILQSRIVGGVETLANEFPEMAGLIQAPTVAVFCGATIISRYYAVTAAHCLTGRPIDELGLLVGDQDYRMCEFRLKRCLGKNLLTRLS